MTNQPAPCEDPAAGFAPFLPAGWTTGQTWSGQPLLTDPEGVVHHPDEDLPALLAIARALAGALPGWRLDVEASLRHRGGACLLDERDRRHQLSRPAGRAGQSRCELRGIGSDAMYARDIRADWPTITFAATRDAASVAGDVTRRYLPRYDLEWERAAGALDSAIRWEQARASTLEELARRLPEAHRTPSGELHAWDPESRLRVGLTPLGNAVDLELGGIPLPLAYRIADLLHEHLDQPAA